MLPKLLAIAKNMDDKNCFYACENIHDLNHSHWILRDERRSYINEEQFVELLIDIALHPNHFYRYDAALLLKRMIGGNEELKNIGKDIILAIAKTPKHKDQKKAIRHLRQSNNPDDQDLGLNLQKQFFQAVWKP